MTKKLARLLKADIQETSDLKSIAAMLAGKGRGGDTLLAHITPKEVNLLKEAGGAGTVNPDTGLLEFYDWSGGYGTTDPTSFETAPSYTPTAGDWSGYQPVEIPSAPAMSPEASYYTQPGVGMADIPVEAASMPMRGAADEYMAAQPPVTAAFPAGQVAAMQIQAPDVKARQELTRQPEAEKEKPFLTNEQYVRLGLAGGLGVYGATQQKKAAEQMKKATAEQTALAKPYQQQGKAMQEAAMRGELTPAGAQQYQALQAQLAQGAAQRGGVGIAQAQAQAEAFRNQLLQNQYESGLKVSQIGDQIALGAIRTGMQLDQQLNQANLGFYTQLGSIAAGIPTYRTQ